MFSWSGRHWLLPPALLLSFLLLLLAASLVPYISYIHWGVRHCEVQLIPTSTKSKCGGVDTPWELVDILFLAPDGWFRGAASLKTSSEQPTCSQCRNAFHLLGSPLSPHSCFPRIALPIIWTLLCHALLSRECWLGQKVHSFPSGGRGFLNFIWNT